jgi:hypothetical protein
MNIAPQLGVVQTKLLKELCLSRAGEDLWNNFSKVVLASGRWRKWTDSEEDAQKVIVAGHYCFNTPEYREILSAIGQHANWAEEIQSALWYVFDNYTTNFQY